MLPIALLTLRIQKNVSIIQTQLEPKIDLIKKKYYGVVMHIIVLCTEYKNRSLSFYSLKPFLISFIQIPILISLFNALGENAHNSQRKHFCGIKDLAYPDNFFLNYLLAYRC